MKSVLLIVGGGIAAYKSLEMVRRLTAASGDDEALIQDIFGEKVDIAKLKAMLGKTAMW